MSVTIDIENFQSWSEIFMEIERQENLKTFTVIESDNKIMHRQERKPRSFTTMDEETVNLNEQGCRRSSGQDGTGQKCSQIQQRKRLNSTPCRRSNNNNLPGKNLHQELIPCSGVQTRARSNSSPNLAIDADRDDLLRQDSRLTAAAQELSNEQMVLLYEDILKPLDVFSILRERRKQTEESD